MKELLILSFILSTFTGAYFRLQLMGYMKPAHQVSELTGWWIFHPEWFEKNGQIFYKMLVVNMLVTFAIGLSLYIGFFYK